MVADIVRDSTFGQIVSYLSKGRYFPYADQRPDYVVPSRTARGIGAHDPPALREFLPLHFCHLLRLLTLNLHRPS